MTTLPGEMQIADEGPSHFGQYRVGRRIGVHGQLLPPANLDFHFDLDVYWYPWRNWAFAWIATDRREVGQTWGGAGET